MFSRILVSFFRKAESEPCDQLELPEEVDYDQLELPEEVDYDASLSEQEQAELEERVIEWLHQSTASFELPFQGQKSIILDESEPNLSMDTLTDEMLFPTRSVIYIQNFIPHSQSCGRSKSF